MFFYMKKGIAPEMDRVLAVVSRILDDDALRAMIVTPLSATSVAPGTPIRMVSSGFAAPILTPKAGQPLVGRGMTSKFGSVGSVPISSPSLSLIASAAPSPAYSFGLGYGLSDEVEHLQHQRRAAVPPDNL